MRTAAARAYLAAVKPYNKTLNTLYKKYKNKTALAALKTYCSKLAANDHAWLKPSPRLIFPTTQRPTLGP